MKKAVIALLLLATSVGLSGCFYAPYPYYAHGRPGWCYYHPYRCG